MLKPTLILGTRYKGRIALLDVPNPSNEGSIQGGDSERQTEAEYRPASREVGRRHRTVVGCGYIGLRYPSTIYMFPKFRCVSWSVGGGPLDDI